MSAPRNPHQNGIVKRKNTSIKDMARIMVMASGLHIMFWAKAARKIFYLCNRFVIRSLLNNPPCELFKGKKLNLSYLRPFGVNALFTIMGKMH